MSKKVSMLLCVLLCIVVLMSSFSSCKIGTTQNDTNGNGQNSTSSNNQSNATTHQHSWKSATCEEPKTCSTCGQTSGSALGHTTDSGTCTRCQKSFGTWELGEFVDEFKKPTGKKYISTQVNGSFSNSATTNSDLIAIVQVTKEDVAIMLWEYGSYSVKCSYKYDDYSITMLDSYGNKYYLDGTMYSGSARIYIDESDEQTVINALKQSGEVSFYIVLSDRTTTNYLFSVETSNFSSLYNKIK